MYCISDKQIEFILNDISARGVKMDSLQQDILDHVCCIIEQNLEENGDFEAFYTKTIKEFYKHELKEIEEETLSLLNNKHFYTMKKVMINSGIFSASVFSLGVILKFLYLPGAAVCIVLGIFFLTFVFLPLMFTLKIKEMQKTRDKLLIGLGTLSAILMTLSILFMVQHWPGAIIMGYLTIGILLLVFLPLYLTSGIRNPVTKVNTIVSSVLLVSGCCLWLTLVVSPSGIRASRMQDTRIYLRSEQIVKNEQKQLDVLLKKDSLNSSKQALAIKINNSCNDLKSRMLEYATGYKAIDTDFAAKNALIDNSFINFSESGLMDEIKGLTKDVEEYNNVNLKLSNPDILAVPVKLTILDRAADRLLDALNDINGIQMIVLQNERALTCMK